MRGTVLYGPRDIRFEERTAPTIMKPTDAARQMLLLSSPLVQFWRR